MYFKPTTGATMNKETNSEFQGSKQYVLDQELAAIVNISMRLEMPLLLKGEPGTGKTMLAHAIAENLNMPLIVLNVKSSMKLVEALYQYDTLTRLNDSRFGDSKRDVSEIDDYIKMGKIGQAFCAEKRTILLIDEIDKADTDFQDDMLDVLDQMQFDIIETDKTVPAQKRPVIIITSNAKKDLSDPFLGRCNFHQFCREKQIRKSYLVNREFCAQKSRNFITFHGINSAGFFSEIGSVNYKDPVTVFNEWEKIKPFCAAVNQPDIFREFEFVLQFIDNMHAYTIIA